MWWLAAWVLVALVGLLGVVATGGRIRFERRVSREVLELWAGAAGRRPLDRGRLDSLPAPVRRYLQLALGTRDSAPVTVRLRHGGTFRTAFDGPWLPIDGRQYFATDPPGFIWLGRIRLAPGLWVEARDRSVGGAGNMLVRAESVLTLADAAGPELDQGALARLLGEMVWFPTAFLDGRYVQWAALDERHARAVLRVGGREAAAVFEFGEDGLPAGFAADRYRDLGGGKSALTPFVGHSLDYRPVGGILVPHRMIAAWQIDGREQEYVRFEVEHLEFDSSEPY
jgi:hypothetical protein